MTDTFQSTHTALSAACPDCYIVLPADWEAKLFLVRRINWRGKEKSAKWYCTCPTCLAEFESSEFILVPWIDVDKLVSDSDANNKALIQRISALETESGLLVSNFGLLVERTNGVLADLKKKREPKKGRK